MLVKLGWAEKVVENLCQIFPEADLYTLIYDEAATGKVFPKEKIHPSCFPLKSQKIYTLTKKQRFCLPFMAKSVESLDFSSYDLVIVSSSWFAHGLRTWKNTKTIIYYHAPARYMWDWTHEYRKDIGFNRWFKGFLFGRLLCKLRQWDYEAAQNNDILLANSATTQKRIWKYFRRESNILYPPIETKRFAKKITQEESENILKNITQWLPESQSMIGRVSRSDILKVFSRGDYYIILSALTEFKRLDIAIHNFKNLPEQNLVIIGKWEYREELEQKAQWSKNIFFVGAQYADDLVALVQNSLGLIFPGEEDFWIVPIEIMAAGKPVFALHKWGLTETVLAGKTGDFFESESGEDFLEKFQTFHKNNTDGKYAPEECKKQAHRYDSSVFERKIKKYAGT